jgi:hypothetical protein
MYETPVGIVNIKDPDNVAPLSRRLGLSFEQLLKIRF